MPTQQLYETASNIDKTLSGSYKFFFGSNGYTGNARISGEVGVSGRLTVNERADVFGKLYLNGQEVFAGNATGLITGSFASLYTSRGDILVGTGVGLYGLQTTGGAGSGHALIYDPSQDHGVRWGEPTLASNTTPLGLSGVHAILSVGRISEIKPTGLSPRGLVVSALGGPSIRLHQSGFNVFIGEGHTLNSLVTGSTCIGRSVVLSQNYEFAQGKPGNNKSSVYIFDATTNSTSHSSIGSITTRPTLDYSSIMSFNALIVVASTTGAAPALYEGAGYEIKGLIKYPPFAVNAEFIGNPTITPLGKDNPAYDCMVSGVGNDLIFYGVPASSEETSWFARVETAQLWDL